MIMPKLNGTCGIMWTIKVI